MTPNPTEPEIVREARRALAWLERGEGSPGPTDLDVAHEIVSAYEAGLQAGLASRPESPYIEGYLTDRVNAGDRLDPRTGKIVNVLARPESGGGAEIVVVENLSDPSWRVEVNGIQVHWATSRETAWNWAEHLEASLALAHPSEPTQSLPSGWRDISSAPKDGSHIAGWLVWPGDDGLNPEPFERFSVIYWDDGCDNPPFERPAAWQAEWIGQPTHWQPLPAAPHPPAKEADNG